MANYYGNSTSNKFKVKKSEKERLGKIFECLIKDSIYTDISLAGEDICGWFGCYV